MCWVCNPFCGRCKPASRKMVVCPQCGKAAIFDKEAMTGESIHVCESCGEDISDLMHACSAKQGLDRLGDVSS